MFIDARQISRDEVIDTEVCVIGAGVAGIALAREMVSRSIRVVMLEGGGLDFDDRTQALNDGFNVGRDYFPLETTRLRYFGGTSNHWGGECTLLDPFDLEERSWLPYSGWPLRRPELDPYYERAHEFAGIGPLQYDGDRWAREQGRPTLGASLERLVAKAAQFSEKRRFGEIYRQELRSAENIGVYLNGNAIELETNETGNTIRGVRVATLEGGRFRISAKVFVLACGAIQNTRILLLSNGVHENGLGNRHGLVGRFFMEHPALWTGRFLSSRQADLHAYFETRSAGEFNVNGYLALSEQVRREEQLLNFAVHLTPIHETPKGVASLKKLLGDLGDASIPDDFQTHLLNVIDDFGSVIDAASRKILGTEAPVTLYRCEIDMEQAPNPDSRVTLSRERDELGQNRAELNWRLGAIDAHTFQRGQEIFGAEMARAGLGRLRMDYPNESAAWPPEVLGHYHHMGTTRMHLDEKQGVVNRDCRVHGLSNLYVAGSSVFPTGGGYVYPTLTIMALAIRLADHLKERLA